MRPLHIGIATGVLIAAGIGGYLGWQAAHQGGSPATGQCEGVVYYFQNDASGHLLNINTPKGLLKLSFEDLEHKTLKALTRTPNGAVVSIAYHTNNGQSLVDNLVITGKIDQSVRNADIIVNNFFSSMACDDYDRAEKMLTTSFASELPAAKLKASYPREQFQAYLSKLADSDQFLPSELSPSNPGQATKIESLADDQTVVLVDSRYIFKKPRGFLAICLRKNSLQKIKNNESEWLIEAIEQNLQPSRWNQS